VLIGGLAIGGYGLSKSNDAEPVETGKSVRTEEVASPPVEPVAPPRTAPATPPGVTTLTPTHTLTGHKGPVGVLRFTPDGGTLYTSD
jgi:hypothetical protein